MNEDLVLLFKDAYNFDDYIILGIAGKLYSCKPDTFEVTYEIIEE
jgi:hypothetical protein